MFADRLRDRERERDPLAHGTPGRLDGKRPPFAHDHRRVAELGRDRRGVECRRHHDQPEILTEHGT